MGSRRSRTRDFDTSERYDEWRKEAAAPFVEHRPELSVRAELAAEEWKNVGDRPALQAWLLVAAEDRRLYGAHRTGPSHGSARGESQQPRRPQGDGRKTHDRREAEKIADDERHHALERLDQIDVLGQGIDDVNVQPYRRRDQSGFHHAQDQDPEPDGLASIDMPRSSPRTIGRNTGTVIRIMASPSITAPRRM